MKYKRFTCKKCGMIINKNATFHGTMDCPENHGPMISKEWTDTFFFAGLVTFFLILICILTIIFKLVLF